MEAKQRTTIVNEDDNRKLEVYTNGDADASPSGIGIFACDPTTTLRILKTDNLGNLCTNVQVGGLGGTVAVKIDPDYNIIQKARSASGTHNKVEIATFARRIIAANPLRKSIIFTHDNTGTLYIGLSNAVTSANIGTGFPFVANQIFGFDEYTGEVYGVLEANPSNIKYIEF